MAAFTPFLRDADIKERVASVLKQDPGNLPTYWDRIIASAHTSAVNDIYGRLTERGYSLTQIQGWDRGAEFEEDLGLYWALTKGAGLASLEDKFIKKLDRREELKTILVSVGGLFVAPTQTNTSVVGFGYMDESLTNNHDLGLTGMGFKDPNTKTQW